MRSLRKLLLALAALALALSGAELYLRRSFPVLSPTYRLDRELLHTTVPGSRRIQSMPARVGGGRHLIRFNSQGYRGPEVEDPKRRGRILVVGDSLVMAGNVDLEDTFPVRLAAELEERYETVNGGLESYGPDQTLLKLERDLQVLEPDLVLLVLCAHNDLGDLLRNKLFRLDGDELVRQRATLAPREVAYFVDIHAMGHKPALYRAWRFFLQARERARLAVLAEGEPPPDWIAGYLQAGAWEYHNAVVKPDLLVYNLRQDTYDADVAIYPDGEAARYKRRLLAAVLGRLAGLCAARGVPVAAVVVPSPADLDPDFRIVVDPRRYPTYSPRALTETCDEALRSAGLAHLDLFELFAESEPSSLFVGWDDMHWNARGIALSAERVAGWLAEQGLLPD